MCPARLLQMLFTSGKLVIRERHIRSNENVILKPHTIPELNTVLDCYSVPNDYIVFNEDLCTDIAVSADARIG